MEFVEGANLRELIKRVINRKNIEESKEDLYIIGGVGEKFAELHALNIALGDTKPENIVVKRNGQICLLDFEQASRKGDKAWDIAEFLYYTGHYSSPFVGTLPTELITRAFIEGYTRARGDVSLIRKAGNPKYTKVFSVFTLPHIIWVISNICRNAGKPKG